MTSSWIRPATDEEINDYQTVDEILVKMDTDRADRIIEAIGDYVFAWKSAERRRAYSRVRGYAKRLHVSVNALVNWYGIDWGV